MEWYHSQSVWRGYWEFKKSPSPGNIMNTVFWDCEEVILMVVVLREEIIKSIPYIRTSKKFNISSEFSVTRIL
jgi:hypothetical protein